MAFASQQCRDRLHSILKEHGELTCPQLSELSGYTEDIVREAVRQDRAKNGSTRFRIARYTGGKNMKLRVLSADGLPDTPRDYRTKAQQKKDKGLGHGHIQTLETINKKRLAQSTPHPFLSLL